MLRLFTTIVIFGAFKSLKSVSAASTAAIFDAFGDFENANFWWGSVVHKVGPCTRREELLYGSPVHAKTF